MKYNCKHCGKEFYDRPCKINRRKSCSYECRAFVRTCASIEERLWKKVIKTDSCWIFNGATNGRRYGIIFNKDTKKPVRVHRISWEIHFGSIPIGMYVCHKCDNPLCVNPKHLFLGTQLDNMRDMIAKGRGRKLAKYYGRS